MARKNPINAKYTKVKKTPIARNRQKGIPSATISGLALSQTSEISAVKYNNVAKINPKKMVIQKVSLNIFPAFLKSCKPL